MTSILDLDTTQIDNYGVPLWKFQKTSVTHLRPKPSALIADEMGLGKTRQAMSRDFVLRSYTETNSSQGTATTLVVCPKSVIPVWSGHYKELMPRAIVYDKLADNKASRAAFLKAAKKGAAHVFITHWEALRSLVGNEEKPGLEKVKFFHIIADECQRAKNRKAQQTVAFKRLTTKYKTALSGTPADNKPQDFWSILNWLWPNRYRSYWNFYSHHIIARTEYNAQGQAFQKMVGVAYAEEFQENIAPFYVRRLKTHVLKDLPEKYYTQLNVDLGPQQRRAYDEMRKNMLAWIGQHEDEPIAAPVVIAQLVRLQQFAGAYARIEERWVNERNKSFNPDLPVEEYGPDATRHTNWKTRRVRKKFLVLDEPSTKLDLLMDLLEDNPDEQFVVFSQSKQIINLFGKRLEAIKTPHGLLTGDTKQADRGRLVEEFQDKKLRVFAGTIAAGGVGITLTSASRVVFLDRAWSPALNLQAEDRLHRIGQKNAVQVIDIMANNTVDLGRYQQIQLKWSWLQQMLGDTVDRDKLLGGAEVA